MRRTRAYHILISCIFQHCINQQQSPFFFVFFFDNDDAPILGVDRDRDCDCDLKQPAGRGGDHDADGGDHGAIRGYHTLVVIDIGGQEEVKKSVDVSKKYKAQYSTKKIAKQQQQGKWRFPRVVVLLRRTAPIKGYIHIDNLVVVVVVVESRWGFSKFFFCFLFCTLPPLLVVHARWGMHRRPMMAPHNNNNNNRVLKNT